MLGLAGSGRGLGPGSVTEGWEWAPKSAINPGAAEGRSSTSIPDDRDRAGLGVVGRELSDHLTAGRAPGRPQVERRATTGEGGGEVNGSRATQTGHGDPGERPARRLSKVWLGTAQTHAGPRPDELGARGRQRPLPVRGSCRARGGRRRRHGRVGARPQGPHSDHASTITAGVGGYSKRMASTSRGRPTRSRPTDRTARTSTAAAQGTIWTSSPGWRVSKNRLAASRGRRMQPADCLATSPPWKDRPLPSKNTE